jgi:hypothetical protein
MAAARFPAFCGEVADPADDPEEICKRELSTILAHMIFETGYYADKSADEAGYFDKNTYFYGLTSLRSCNDLDMEESGDISSCTSYNEDKTADGTIFRGTPD